MPIFEYKCNKCSERFEIIKFAKEDPSILVKPVCPTCKGTDVSKLVSECNFKLKGRGWAKDGYQK